MKNLKARVLLLTFCAFTFLSIFLISKKHLESSNDYPFEIVRPEAQGASLSALEELVKYSDELSAINGLLLLRNDKIIFEHYKWSTKKTKWAIKSAFKSFVTAILLLSLDEGYLSLHDKVCGRNDMTVHHLASMAAGIRKSSRSDCQTPLLFTPGTDFSYSDASVRMLIDFIESSSGNLDFGQLLIDKIFNPIGIHDFEWDETKRVRMTVHDMARYGRLWLHKGNWNGVQLLNGSNVEAAIQVANPNLRKDYGYLWWVNSQNKPGPYDRYGFKLNPVFGSAVPSDAFMAIGCSRTFILVIPSLDLVAVRAGTKCISIRNGASTLTDQARRFSDLVAKTFISHKVI